MRSIARRWLIAASVLATLAVAASGQAGGTADAVVLCHGTSSTDNPYMLAGAVERANKKLAEDGQVPIFGLTNHSLRRTFASLLYEAGASRAT